MPKQIFRSFLPWYRLPWYIIIAKLLSISIKSAKELFNNPRKEKPMPKLIYETEEAIFEFPLPLNN